MPDRKQPSPKRAPPAGTRSGAAPAASPAAPADPGAQVAGSAGATVSGPGAMPPESASSGADLSQARLMAQRAGAQALAAAMPHNPLKPFEIGLENGHAPVAGQPNSVMDEFADHQHRRADRRQPELAARRARGPTLLEDFILREKITHFDHERIPERVVHARGSGRARLLRAAPTR
jgi:hypothetical protein